MSLFQQGDFTLHSGAMSSFKIDCSVFRRDSIQALAALIAGRFDFGCVEGVPTGGLALADELWRASPWFPHGHRGKPLLIVDDVLTTGASMEKQRAGRDAIGVVVFARGPCPSWVTPIFQMWSET